jgi:hypothetical protein
MIAPQSKPQHRQKLSTVALRKRKSLKNFVAYFSKNLPHLPVVPHAAEHPLGSKMPADARRSMAITIGDWCNDGWFAACESVDFGNVDRNMD